MTVFLLKKLGSSLALLWGLLTLIFFVAHSAPGDPVGSMISPAMSTRVADDLRHQFGFDRPLLVQYEEWLQNVVTGNWGVSFRHQRPVSEVLGSVLPNTAMLAMAAVILELLLGLIFGALAARREGSLLDRIVSNTGMVLYTLPSFLIGMALLLLFSYRTGIFPPGQMHSFDSENGALVPSMIDLLWHLILPALTIAIPGAAGIARYFRSGIVTSKRNEHVLFAESMGLSPWKTFFYHILPNALAPVISFAGVEIGLLMTGAVVTETLFAWPGMGRLAVQAILSRDYPLIMGCTMAAGAVVILGNVLADILYAALDPRVRLIAGGRPR